MLLKKNLYKKELKVSCRFAVTDCEGKPQIASEKKNFDFFEVVENLNQSSYLDIRIFLVKIQLLKILILKKNGTISKQKSKAKNTTH